MQIHSYDVVIVGAGGAGMRAAIEAGRFADFRAAFHAAREATPAETG